MQRCNGKPALSNHTAIHLSRKLVLAKLKQLKTLASALCPKCLEIDFKRNLGSAVYDKTDSLTVSLLVA